MILDFKDKREELRLNNILADLMIEKCIHCGWVDRCHVLLEEVSEAIADVVECDDFESCCDKWLEARDVEEYERDLRERHEFYMQNVEDDDNDYYFGQGMTTDINE